MCIRDRSTLIWLGLLVIGFLFFADFRIAMALGNTLGHLMLIACSCFFIPYLLICLYIFPVQAKFKNTIYDNLKNAFFMAIRHFPLTLLLVVIDTSFVLFFFSSVPFIGLAPVSYTHLGPRNPPHSQSVFSSPALGFSAKNS